MREGKKKITDAHEIPKSVYHYMEEYLPVHGCKVLKIKQGATGDESRWRKDRQKPKF